MLSKVSCAPRLSSRLFWTLLYCCLGNFSKQKCCPVLWKPVTCCPKVPNSDKDPNAWLMQKLKRYGVAGVLSYGLLNTVYYLTTFLFVWFYFAPAPGRIGYPAAVKRFFKVMAMVWAGSQVTKVLRAGGALAMCPFVDRGLSWFTVKFSFESEGKAFAAIAGLCFGLAFLLFLWLTILWA